LSAPAIFMKESRDTARCRVGREDREATKSRGSAKEAESRAKAIVIATAHYNDPKILADVSEQMTGAMHGLAIAGLEEGELLQTRGW